MRNFRARCGELDLVALHAGAVLVVEVRHRQRHEWGGAAASVDARKRQRILRTTRRLLQCHPELNRRPLRFDVIVCDGFVGNVALKASEGLATMVSSFIRAEFSRSIFTKMAAIIATADKKPVYVDCNAVSPKRKVVIGDTILNSGAPFVDVGITGLPPRAGHSPTLHAAGPDAGKFGVLNDFGIKVNVIEGPIGAASALKMSYAGITKGKLVVWVRDEVGNLTNFTTEL